MASGKRPQCGGRAAGGRATTGVPRNTMGAATPPCWSAQLASFEEAFQVKRAADEYVAVLVRGRLDRKAMEHCMDEVLKALIDRLLPRGTLPRFSQQGALTEIIIAGDSRTYIGWGDGWAAWHEDRGWVQELVSATRSASGADPRFPRCSIKSSREIAPGLRPSSIIRARSSAYRHVGSSSTTRSPKAQEWRWAGAFSILRSRPEGQLRLSRPLRSRGGSLRRSALSSRACSPVSSQTASSSLST